MPSLANSNFRVGDVRVDPALDEIRKEDVTMKLEPRTMRLLVCLAERAGQVVSVDELLDLVWKDVVVSSDSVYQAVATLRRALGDDSKEPKYIANVTRRGYRLVAPVSTGVDTLSQPPTTEPPVNRTDSVPLTEGAPESDPQHVVSHAVPRPLPVASEPARTRQSPRRLVAAILGMATIAIALGYFVAGQFSIPERSASPAGETTRSSVVSDTSVAVLPFLDLSENKDQEYFADGMSEELIDVLTRVPHLRVPARTSSFYFKGKQATIAEIAKALRVTHVLEGSVRKAGKALRISAQLVRVDNGYHVWSETYDRKLDDIFQIQDEIAGAVVSALKVSLLGGMPATVGTTNTSAYTLYLQARSIFQLGTKANYETALEYLQKAIVLDPTFAAAWADAAKVLVRQWRNGYIPLKLATDEARQAAQRALALDPQLSAAHLSMGRVHYMFDWDWLTSEADIKRAIELDPGNADAYRWATYVAGTLGRFDEAIALAEQAVSKDPLEPLNYYAICDLHYRAGRYAEADAAWRKARDLNPELSSGDQRVGLMLLTRGDAAAALAEFKSGPEHNWGLALAYYALGRKAESDAALARLIALRAADSSMAIAHVFAYRRELDHAFEWLERAYRQHDSELPGIKGDPLLKNLESDARYKAFLHKMKLPVRDDVAD